MELKKTVEEALKELNIKKPVVIYGAGWSGKVIYDFLKRKGASIIAFAVTLLDRNSEIEGIPVFSLDNILSQYPLKEFSIILAAQEPNRYIMEKELKKRQINSYIVLSDKLLYEVNIANRKAEAEEVELIKEGRKAYKTVGYLSPGYLDTDYAEQRLIINKIKGFHYVALPKETINIDNINFRQEANLEIYRNLSEACYCPDKYVPEIDLIHTFNAVCDTDKPWCASFETVLPRVWFETEGERQYYLQLIECMKRSNCKAMYALCRNAYNIQKTRLMSHVSREDARLLMEKTKVLHPPQEVLITDEEFNRKHNTEKIHFIFIGKAFFLKGGREIIRTLLDFEKQYDFKLTLISSMQYADYFTKTSYKEMVRYKEIIRNKKWIDYYETLPNEEVLEKCKKATVGLFPSVADTYGYSILEMQATGCPVITTNVRAFPEINNEDCGWICHLPVDNEGCCADRGGIVWPEILEKELKQCLQEIFDTPEIIKKKGKKAMERIRKMHDPYEYQKELRKNLL